MSTPGMGRFHVYYYEADGTEVRKAYRTWEEADAAREFLEGLGIRNVEIDMHKTKNIWKPE